MNHSRVTATRNTPLSEEDVQRILASYKKGEVGYVSLARTFGVSQTTVRKVLKNSDIIGQSRASIAVEPCRTGKRLYANYTIASAAASSMSHRTTSGASVWAYRCPDCQMWHIGKLRP